MFGHDSLTSAGGADIDFYVGAPKQSKPNVRGADM
jgi:hypothetical protein